MIKVLVYRTPRNLEEPGKVYWRGYWTPKNLKEPGNVYWGRTPKNLEEPGIVYGDIGESHRTPMNLEGPDLGHRTPMNLEGPDLGHQTPMNLEGPDLGYRTPNIGFDSYVGFGSCTLNRYRLQFLDIDEYRLRFFSFGYRHISALVLGR
ncbi:unnamed protein product [Rhizophagus irregularis]|nr:unnamed protein product [Rhizophagus irregularis]